MIIDTLFIMDIVTDNKGFTLAPIRIIMGKSSITNRTISNFCERSSSTCPVAASKAEKLDSIPSHDTHILGTKKSTINKSAATLMPMDMYFEILNLSFWGPPFCFVFSKQFCQYSILLYNSNIKLILLYLRQNNELPQYRFPTSSFHPILLFSILP